PAILISSWSCLRKTYFCFKGADSEVNLAKIIQTEVTFAKRKLNLLFTHIFLYGNITYSGKGRKNNNHVEKC
ncbi:MAG: hypothetical protein U0M75_09590, partial [Lachnospiraceae bacterium]